MFNFLKNNDPIKFRIIESSIFKEFIVLFCEEE